MPLEVEDKCLAFHGPLLYAAKILKVHDPDTPGEKQETKNDEQSEAEEVPANLKDQQCYYIHYRGWKSSWDEWVGLDRIREYTDENLEYKRQLVEQAKDARQAKKKAPAKPRKMVEPRKRKSQPGSTPDDAVGVAQPQGPRIAIHISQTLKAVLVDDWERITKDKKLVQLPCKSTAADLLDKYYKSASAQEISPVLQSQLQEYCNGLKLYFDHSLAVILLYRFERMQYADHMQEQPSTVYGAIHLMRLLSNLPELVSLTSMDEYGCEVVVQQTDKLLKWLENQSDLFSENTYVNTSSQYEGMALGL
ncbi:LAFA_0D11386g1_1 [Lachancea sp. 'fantastica']|nr:LAFA_0D11386g1_1 [Lachancea sp. 'fantastica']